MPGPDISTAYDARAQEYIEKLGSVEQMAPADRRAIQTWRDSLQGRVLDAGCGPGHWSEVLARGGLEVVGIDGSTRFIESARRRFPRLNFLRGDLAALPLATDSVDGILSWFRSSTQSPSTSSPSWANLLAY